MSEQIRIAGYCDLLGFSDLAVTDTNSARSLLSDFYNMAQDTKVHSGYDDLEIFLFSDFLFIQGDDVSQVVNYLCEMYRSCLKYSAEPNNRALLCRGGVARGAIVTQRRNEAPRMTKNFIVSPALTHAVHMEKLVKGQRLLISANEKEELDHFWNRRLASITYDQPSIKPTKLFLQYRYQDLLWARDLAKPYQDSKEETTELIKAAAYLFHTNSRKPKAVLSHYAETLRICLLSYTSLLEPCAHDRQLLESLVEEILLHTPHEAVWLGFLEMVTLSRDAFAFQDDRSVLRFLQRAIMSPKWGNICEAMSRDNQGQLRDAVEDLLSVAIHIPAEQ